MNKKGFMLPGFAIVSMLVVGVILVALFLLSDKIRWILIGVAMLVGFVYLLGKVINGDVTKPKIAILLIFLGIGLFFVFGADVLQSVLSVDTVELPDGQMAWIVYASATSIDEGYRFRYNPQDTFNSKGEEIKPQQSIDLFFSKDESFCKYPYQTRTKTIKLLGFISKSYTYTVLGNPDRTAVIKIKDGNNKIKTIDGTSQGDQVFFSDSDNLGTLVVEAQGLLSGKHDCPSFNNVAILYDGTQRKVVYEDDVIDELERVGGLFGSISALISGVFNDVEENRQFTSSFNDFETTSTSFIGDINLGSGTFTITADQQYFDSIVVIPSKSAIPEIVSINIPRELKAFSTNSMSVTIKNNGYKGNIIVKVDSSKLSITQEEKNVLLDNTKTVFFTIKTINQITSGDVNVEVCGISQFNVAECDEMTKSFNIIEDQPVEYCGNFVCESTENKATCPSDCEEDDPIPDPIECAFYQESYTTTKEDCGTLGWKKITPFVSCETFKESGCRTSSWVYLIVFGLFVLIIVILLLPSSKKTSQNRLKQVKK